MLLVDNPLAKAYELAEASSDRSNQNGAVLLSADGQRIIGMGRNDFPPGVEFTEERATTRPKKYRYYEHAERWAVYNAALKGKTTEGSIMVCPWAACADCARALICAGVAKLIVHKQRMLMTPDRWIDDVTEALEMIKEAGIVIEEFDGPVGGPRVLVNGELWLPSDEPQAIGVGNWFTSMTTS